MRVLNDGRPVFLEGEDDRIGRGPWARWLATSVVRDEALLAQAATALQSRETVLRRLAQAESAVAQAEEATRTASALEGELGERQRMLREGAFAVEARRELRRLERDIGALAYDEKGHAALRACPPRRAWCFRAREDE